MNLRQIGMEVMEESVAVFASELLGLNDLVQPGDSELMRWAKNGAIWTVLEDATLFFKTGQSHFLNGDVYYFVDQTFFNTAIWALLDKSNIGERVETLGEDKLPFNPQVNGAVARGVIKVGAKMVQNMIARNYMHTPLSYLVSVTSMTNLRPVNTNGGSGGLF